MTNFIKVAYECGEKNVGDSSVFGMRVEDERKWKRTT